LIPSVFGGDPSTRFRDSGTGDRPVVHVIFMDCRSHLCHQAISVGPGPQPATRCPKSRTKCGK
jgi:hypothetical protein